MLHCDVRERLPCDVESDFVDRSPVLDHASSFVHESCAVASSVSAADGDSIGFSAHFAPHAAGGNRDKKFTSLSGSSEKSKKSLLR